MTDNLPSISEQLVSVGSIRDVEQNSLTTQQLHKPNSIQIAVVFDIDKTIIRGNLHEIYEELWTKEGSNARARIRRLHNFLLRQFLPSSIARRLEYFFSIWVSHNKRQQWARVILNDTTLSNKILLTRLRKYQQRGVSVLLVTAAPRQVAEGISHILDTQLFASKSFAGFVTKDILAKKPKIYRAIEKSQLVSIRSIYSDSELDFVERARNFHVNEGGNIRTLFYKANK